MRYRFVPVLWLLAVLVPVETAAAETVHLSIGDRKSVSRPDTINGPRYDVLSVRISPECDAFDHRVAKVNWSDRVEFGFGEGATLGRYELIVRYKKSWKKRGRRRSKIVKDRHRLVLGLPDQPKAELTVGGEYRIDLPPEVVVKSFKVGGKYARAEVHSGSCSLVGLKKTRTTLKAKLTYNFVDRPLSRPLRIYVRYVVREAAESETASYRSPSSVVPRGPNSSPGPVPRRERGRFAQHRSFPRPPLTRR